MKPIIVKTKYLKKFFGIRGIALWPFIFYTPYFTLENHWAHNKIVTYAMNRRVLRHERIHIRQQAELWVVGFYVLYLWYYFGKRFKGLSHKSSYRLNPFEVEAYAHENNLDYLDHRPKHNWKQYQT